MNQEDLKKTDESLSEAEKERQEYLNKWGEKYENLSPEEKIERRKHLRKLANGELQGPPVGYSSIDNQWLKHYDEKALEYQIPDCSVYQYFEQKCKRFGSQIAMIFGEPESALKISYSKLFKMVNKTAKALKKAGVKKGDCVSVCLPNIPEVQYIFYAINKVGAVANMLDPRTNPENLKSSINDANSKLLLSMDAFCPVFNQIIDDTKLEQVVGISPISSVPKIIRPLIKKKDPNIEAELPKNDKFASWDKFLNRGRFYFGKTEEKFTGKEDAVIAYTGGTTGISKGVVADNKCLNTMIVENSVMGFDVQPGDLCLNIAPPWTYYGLSNCMNAYNHLGAVSIMVPKFEPDDLAELVFKYKPNHVIAVPSCLISLMKDKRFDNMDLSFIKTIIVGADKLDPTFEAEFDEWLASHNSKCKVTKGYGMTEVTAAATYTKDGVNEPGTVGVPFVAENVSIFDPETGKELPTGQVGEIAIKGDKNMKGYFGQNEDRTPEVLKQHEDGTVWAHSADLGYMDKDGVLRVTGRIKRMFTTYGFKVFSDEIERNIYKHHAVQQCAVIPVPDESVGNSIKAFVVLKDEYKNQQDVVQQEITELLKKSVFEYEIPSEYEFRDSLPLTGMNKINFKALEDEEKEKKKNEARVR